MEDDLAFEEETDEGDLILMEKKRKARELELLRRTAGQPVKPKIEELQKMKDNFITELKQVLAEELNPSSSRLLKDVYTKYLDAF